MTLLHAGVDTAVIALWLGHADIRSTDAYLHADMTIKERALDLTTHASTPPGRYRPTDKCSPSWKACDYADHRTPPVHERPTAALPFTSTPTCPSA